MNEGDGRIQRFRPKGKRSIVVAVAGFFLVAASVAFALTGLQNPGFENDLDSWEVHTERGSGSTRQIVYGDGGTKGEPVPCDEKPYGICVVGTDTFSYFPDNGPSIATQTVTPVEGDKMLRLGGPFGSSRVRQNNDRFVVQQTFTVDAAEPVLQLNYNVFTFDYSGYDELEFRATLVDEDGDLIASRTQGSFAAGVGLKTTGWRPNSIDLAPYAGEQVTMRITSGGTRDELYGFWAYVDAGTVEAPPVSGENATATAPQLPGGGGAVALHKYTDPNTGQSYFTVPSSQAALFPGGCMPLTYTVPITPGAGTVSNVDLVLNGNRFPMTKGSGDNWTGTIDCVESGPLTLEYDLTEGSTTQHFIVPLGGLVLIDPQGVVYDSVVYDAAIANGKTPAQARSEAAISGATVKLQRKVGGNFVDVLSGDPGISPNVNPEVTGSDGLYQWDVSAGEYRVLVTKPGYLSVTSRVVTVPPPVLDLHIGMTPVTGTTNPPPPGGGGAPAIGDTQAPDTTITKGPKKALKLKKKKAKAKFSFSSSEPNSTFECKLDKADWKACGSSASISAGKGSHTLQVRAIDAAGNVDASPATAKFKVKAAKKKK